MFTDAIVPRSRILGTGSYLPERIVDNAELEGRLDTTAAWIMEHTGIARRHVAAEGETTSDLATKAARRAIEASGLSVADLDLIILATSTGDSPLPACAVHLQQKLGADLIPSFDVNASSAGFLYALTIADQFVAAGTYKTVLVAAADLPSRVVRPNDRATVPLFGDGGGAVVLGPSSGDGRGILSSRIHADGTLADLMQIPGGGSAEPLTPESLERGRHYLHLDGRPLYDVTVRHLTSYSMQALKGARLTSAELNWVIPQQASMPIVNTISGRLGFPLDKFVLNLEDCGNTLAASIPIALDQAVRDGRVKEGQTVLACSLGAGVAWGAMMIRM
ncbi:MAG: ketoacyl-ACP synthase III [Myxococcales bacterium]|nr:ketoacyl-ACP synthase III [Myxococcales bacterium]